MKLPRVEREEVNHVSAKVMNPATGMSSSVKDLITFYQAHFYGNNKLFADVFKREMQSIQFQDSQYAFDQAHWGLGFRTRKMGKISYTGHSGGYNFGKNLTKLSRTYY